MKTVARAKREAAQPSLWDRLINDLPGLASEIDGLRKALSDELGAERLEELLADGPRSVAADQALTTEQKQRLSRLDFQVRKPRGA
jgi:type VI secretion system protein ImpF